jgi:hypothetical protein
MSKITSPILLDSTGQDIRGTLVGIQEALLAQNAFIDDNTTAADRVWSSKKIMESLTVEETSSGSTLDFHPVSATPISVEMEVTEAASLVLTHTNGERTRTCEVYIPVPGHFNWGTGVLQLANGNTVHLVGQPITALPGLNTLSINMGTIEATYRVIGTGSGGSAPSWDVIHGGNATKEV